jgi:hypothetical protein
MGLMPGLLRPEGALWCGGVSNSSSLPELLATSVCA